MRARCIVVGEVPAQQASEMPFAEDDDVIEAFASNRPDDALGEGILPGCSWGDEDLVDSHAFHASCENVAVGWRRDHGVGTWVRSLPGRSRQAAERPKRRSGGRSH
jgi:hypothetical protein